MTRQPIWTRPGPTGATGRPAEYSRGQITDAALAVADSDGLGAVTMRRVAAELGTGAASLYRHLTTRDDLLDLMIDRALAAYRPPPVTGDPGVDVVADLVHRLELLRTRPWLVEAIDDAHGPGPQGVRLIELSLERLAGHPAPGPAKLEAITVLAGMLFAQARQEVRGKDLDEERVAATMGFLHRIANDGDHPHLAAALAPSSPPPAGAETPDERFARVLGLVLEGLLG